MKPNMHTVEKMAPPTSGQQEQPQRYITQTTLKWKLQLIHRCHVASAMFLLGADLKLCHTRISTLTTATCGTFSDLKNSISHLLLPLNASGYLKTQLPSATNIERRKNRIKIRISKKLKRNLSHKKIILRTF